MKTANSFIRRAVTYLLILNMCALLWHAQVARPTETAPTRDIATNGYTDTDFRATQFESFNRGAHKFKPISFSRPRSKVMRQCQVPDSSN